MVLPLIGALVGAGAGIIGGMMQNSAASAAADKQMAFQKDSAQHQYQWAMSDMEKAGLNPILAYKQGGAGTLSGSSYTPQNIGTAAVQGASQGTSSAVAATRNNAEIANIMADTNLKASQDKTQNALQVQAMAQAGQANANSALATQQTINAWNQEELLRSSIIQNLPKNEIAKRDLEFWTSPAAGPLLATRRFFEAINPGASVANSAANLAHIGR